MWLFVKRYFGWYLWLGIYTTAIGALIGFAIFCISPFVPVMIIWFGLLYGLAVACAASVVGGAGNGVQWVGVVSAVQELTAARMQARVLGTLESVASATPGLGYLLGGLIASNWSPRATFLVAGAGVMAIVVASALLLGRNWPLEQGKSRPRGFDAAADEIMVELIPAEALPSPDRRS